MSHLEHIHVEQFHNANLICLNCEKELVSVYEFLKNNPNVIFCFDDISTFFPDHKDHRVIIGIPQ